MKTKRKSVCVLSLTFLGLAGAVCMQFIWLYNTYQLVKITVQEEAYAILEKALEKESAIRFSMLPEGTEIFSGSTNDTIPNMTYFYERLSDMGHPIIIEKVDSIVLELLNKEGIYCESIVQLISPPKNMILQQSRNLGVFSFFNVQTKYFPIRADYNQGVRLVLVNPNKVFLERMGMPVLSTAVLMVIVVGCIIYLINIISNLNGIGRKREEFTYALVHDMKTPLTSIMTTLRFLYTGQLEKKPELKEKFCNIALTETDNLLALTNRVLTIAKLESNKLDMNKHVVELQPMMDELTEKFTAQATKPIRFSVRLDAPCVYADAGYLKEVISNLIDNAIKYSGKEVDISIISTEEERYTVIKVRDNGFGISLKDQRIIFNKFERGEATGRRKGGASGFGLGLNFVNQVVEAHGGRVLLQSIKGEFTEFEVHLPKENYEEIVKEYQINKM